MTRRAFLLTLAFLAAAACGPVDGETMLTSDLGAAEDGTSPVDLEADEMPAPTDAGELAQPDETWDFAAPEATDASTDPLPGEAGYPCQGGADCNEGHCIQTTDGMQCTVTCQEECPFDWLCLLHSPSLPDQVYICVPTFVALCRPCLNNTDCWTNGVDGGEACVSYGGAGYFCGGECAKDEDCPGDYTCQEREDVSGGTAKQCVLLDNECQCSQWYIDAGAATTCFVENELGSCPGERSCKATGLTECSAKDPAAESCNGEDDDCDGQTDEELDGADCLVTNQFGSCPGLLACVNGKQACDGKDAKAELCDGEDNDCDGQIDEGFPDTDDDGVADCLETDKDGDGIPDGLDNCPSLFNPGQPDNDLDNMGDECDPDDDNDMTADGLDCDPFDPEIHPGTSEICDGKDNNCNYIVDEGFIDSDTDGWKDCSDEDDDNDGAPDDDDCAPLDSSVHPDAAELCDGKDNNCDDSIDEGFPDLDENGVADCQDADIDGDGAPNQADNCPNVANPGQENFDGDEQGDLCDKDADGDSIPDGGDNCLFLKNSSQSDVDGDEMGDPCDDDIDGDGAQNALDNCPLVANPGQEDEDGNGTGNACSNDKDGDGTEDMLDCAPLNPAVNPGAQEVCDSIDNDCDYMVDEGFIDSDLDSLKDCVDEDDDNDGDPDETDCMPLNPAIHSAAAEVCDGIDNNCDGKIDELTAPLSCGKGECFHTIDSCVGGIPQTCDAMAGAALESCDGLDNDCDGLVDEDLGTKSCGLGICQHTVNVCTQGVPAVCDPGEGAEDELCDGLDNDCDGKVDEEMAVLACGKGQCFHSTPSCVGGVEYQCDPFAGATKEVCDGQDNDCDGTTDEDLGTTTCGLGQCEHTVDNCLNGAFQICNPLAGASAEICDNLDNDCDSIIDEDQGTTTCGIGVCQHTVPDCVAGQPNLCEPLDGAVDEECDGLDNDCDEEVDEDFPDTDEDGTADCMDNDDDGDSALDGDDNCPLTANPGQDNLDGDEYGDLCDEDIDGDGALNEADNCPQTDNAGQENFDDDEFGDMCDDDDDNDGDPDETDCEPFDDAIGHTIAEVCFNNTDDDCDGQVDGDPACIKTTCKALHDAFPQLPDGQYPIDLDGEGGLPQFNAWCDMTTDGGGWTIVYAATGADNEQPMTSNAEVAGEPASFAQPYNLNRQKKMIIANLSTTGLFRRDSGTWIKVNSALYDEHLEGDSHWHQAVSIIASDGATAEGWIGYSTYNIAGGGDYNVSMTDGGTCNGTTNQGVDHHSTNYYHLNCGCQRQYLYSYSSQTGDSDAGYDVNTALGEWAVTNGCQSEEGGALKFYAAMR